MKKLLTGLILASFFVPLFADAHRSGCHRWHSCPSDSGSYVCGDLGYTSGCPRVNPVPKPSVSFTSATSNFVGIPTTQAELNRCLIVGNGASHIYHLKGSSFIKTMNLKKKTCFATERDAQKAGYKKSKTK